MKIHCITHDDHTVDIPGDTHEGMVLDHQELHRALLNEVQAPRASFRHANLRGAFMADAVFDSSDFTGANIITAFLDRSSLVNCCFRNCVAFYCGFRKVDLRGADLTGAKVNGAHFDGARVQGARLLCIDLELATFNGARYDAHTVCSVGFNPQAAGACLEE
jgi:uncharacterized protein YjbI with pentapeptide repeats